MKRRSSPVRIVALLAGPLLALAAVVADGQPPEPGPPAPGAPPIGGDDLGIQLGPKTGVLGEGDRVPKFDAGFTSPEGDGSAQLFITATLPSGAHTYSITQPEGGTYRTTIKVEPSSQYEVKDFQTLTAPEIEHDETSFPHVPLECHYGSVKWAARVQFRPGARPETVKIGGSVNLVMCDAHGCAPPKDYPFTAGLRPGMKPLPFIASSSKVGQTPAPAVISASPPPATAGDNSSAPVAKPLSPAETANHGNSVVDGEIEWVPFTNAADLKQMVSPEFDLDKIRDHVRKQGVGLGFWEAIFAGFLGGLILNVMPCVLPVIGLKILSFVEQSGHNRRKAFLLNVWYSAGLLSVFFVLASLAVGPQKLGWGELFGQAWFTIALCAVVFVMALSFLGVWEVPLPAFLGGGKAGELAAHEGAVGAYFKGVLTTFLATPCSAPFLAPALVWATAQPPVLTYAVFLSVGLGMASPYLLAGAFPELLRFLPKPGPWMETFKQFMGFVLMGTVVYFLAVLEPAYAVPTVGLLFGLAFLCWWVGRISPVADLMVHLRAWALGAAFVCVVWIVMFPGLNSSVLGRFHFFGLAAANLEKVASSETDVAKKPHAGIVGPKTVLVEFTASWCQNCHFFKNTVLRSAPVIDSLRQLGVVAVEADWSHGDHEVGAMLEALNGKQIPVIAIFSAKDPNHPAVFRGSYSQHEILDALQKAGPSPGAPSLAQTM